MAVITETQEHSILDQLQDGEQLEHTHSHSTGPSCAVTLQADPEVTELEDSHSCLYCEYTIEYPENYLDGDYHYYYETGSGEYVCGEDGCSWSSESEKAVKGHQTREHETQDEEETETDEDEQQDNGEQEDENGNGDEGNGDDDVDE